MTDDNPGLVEKEANLAIAHGIIEEMTPEKRHLLLLHLSVIMISEKPEHYFFIVDKVKEE
jgi:hypothetical protein